MIETKSVFASIVGKPNVGKSTLLNNIIGEKIAIVSPKPQTTRTRITGILTEGEIQMVFIDTPGIHLAKNKLGEYMVKQSKASINDVDIIIMMIEADKRLNEQEIELIKNIKESKMPAVLVINKVDKIKEKDLILEKINEVSKMHEFDTYIPISAKNGDGVSIVVDEVKKHAQLSPHFFEDDMITDQIEKVIMAEVIREKMLFNLFDEIPYGIGVVVEKVKERPKNNLMDIDAIIYCERDSHKGIVIGKKGAMLKKIATQAREDLEEFFNVKINLQVWVKVKQNWRNHANVMKALGYEDI